MGGLEEVVFRCRTSGCLMFFCKDLQKIMCVHIICTYLYSVAILSHYISMIIPTAYNIIILIDISNGNIRKTTLTLSKTDLDNYFDNVLLLYLINLPSFLSLQATTLIFFHLP